MNKLLLRFLLVTLLLFSSGYALACQFNTDCAVGSQCLKTGGNINGYCVGGLNPGNSNDRKPAYNPLDLTGKQGSTCSFNTDCGVGGVCAKAGGIYGTCL
jgi:hypothetical protein